MGGLTVLAVVVVAYTLVASKLDRWWITGPMVFVAAGAVLGPGGLDVLPLSLTNEAVVTVTELTLALLLFSDASTVRLREVEGDAGLPAAAVRRAAADDCRRRAAGPPDVSRDRLGGSGIGRDDSGAHRRGARTGGGHQQGRFRCGSGERSTSRAASTTGSRRRSSPCSSPSSRPRRVSGIRAWGLEAFKQIGLAIVAAVVVGYVGGRLMAFAKDRGWTSDVSEQIAILALALLAYEGSVAIGGNGFVAAFAGGILFGAATRRRLDEPVQFTETLGLSAIIPGVVDLRCAVRRRAVHP